MDKRTDQTPNLGPKLKDRGAVMDVVLEGQELQFDACTRLSELPSEYDALFREVGTADFFLSRDWFENFERHATDEGDALAFFGVRPRAGNTQGLALLIGRVAKRGWSSFHARSFHSLANFYTMSFAPLVSINAENPVALIGALLRGMAKAGHRYDVMSLGPLHPEAAIHGHLTTALRERGFLVERFVQFGNWFEPINGRPFSGYLESRPSILRNTLRRRGKQLAKLENSRFEVVDSVAGLEGAIQAYLAIYATSWKQPERYPDFIPQMIRMAARCGSLRLGLLYIGDVPAAAQIWIVSGARAVIYKLAYDPQFKSLSVGSLLTEYMMRYAMERDRVEEVDYGSGDDEYKKDWMSQRRERVLLTAYNLRTVRGLLLATANRSSRWIKSASTRIPVVVGPAPQGRNTARP